MDEKHKQTCRNLNYFEHSFLFISAVSSCFNFSICLSSWSSLGIASSAVGLTICSITTAVIKK